MSTILIVDDHVQYLSSVCQLLKLHLPQTQILTALDRSTAVQQVQAHACDLLILDYQLQVTTGTQLLRQLRARSAAVGRPLPPVVLTSSQPDVDLYARTAGVEAFVPKPMLDEHVTGIIIPLLRRAGTVVTRRPLLWSIR